MLYANEKLSDAIVAAEKLLTIDRDLFKDAPAKLADTLEMLAECYWEHDNFDAARKAQQEALDIKINLLGKDHWQVTDARHKLDEYALYKKLYLALMPQQRDRMAEAKKLNRQVTQLYLQGKYAAAIGYAKQVQAICDEIFGQEHLVTAISLDNLAQLYNAQGNYSKALPLYQQVLKIREKVLGPEHRDTASTLSNLADLYGTVQGNLADALSACQKALKIRENALGPEHPDTAVSLNCLGMLYEMKGSFDEALPLFQRTEDSGESSRAREYGDGH